ncbi:MAG: hypothetical protein ACOY0T_23470 [Myxococcota bacterium]
MQRASAQRARATSTILTLVVAIGAGCSQAKRAPVPTDCTVLDRYELHPNADFNSSNWFSSGDCTNGVLDNTKVAYETLDENVCGVAQGIHFTSDDNQNWGSVAGNFVIGGFQAAAPINKDASAYQGLSFWARSNYARIFAVILGDDTSTEIEGGTSACIPLYRTPITDGGVPPTNICGTSLAQMPNPDAYSMGSVPVANACGSPFIAQLVTNDRWQFFAIPFSAFTQVAQDPRVKPGGINKSSIFSIAIRAPKDSTVESWFANFAWYREK